MSIHVTVTGNPVYLGRGKVLLTDIETAKKNEWLRRRKIRLQQARQQAKDLAQSVRKKVSCQENIVGKNEEEKKIEEQNKVTKERITSLQNDYLKSVSSFGTGHHLASIQNECDALAQEKQDLLDIIAKARGAIAEERLKAEKCIQKEKSQVTIGRKKKARQIEDLRSTLICNLPEAKSSVHQTKNQLITKVQVHQSEELEGGAAVSNRKVVSPSKKFLTSSRQRGGSTTRSSLSPPRSIKQPLACRQKRTGQLDEDILSDEESDDSDVTWPPRSARVTKESLHPTVPPRVRFYDHNSRIVKNSPRPSYSVMETNPFEDPDMYEAIVEEEEAIVRKENLDVLARRERMIRGNKALRKERSKREAEKFLKEFRELHRKEKIQMAVDRTYPNDLHTSDFRRKEMEAKRQREMKFLPTQEGFVVQSSIPSSKSTIGVKACDLLNVGVKVKRLDPESPQSGKLNSSTESEDFFQELVNKLKVERAKKQDELEKKFGAKDVNESDIPPWVKCQESPEETAGPSGIRIIHVRKDRAVSPLKCELISKTCSCSAKCICCTHQVKIVENEKELIEPRNIVGTVCEPDSVNGEKLKGNEPDNRLLDSLERGEIQTAVMEENLLNASPGISRTSGSPCPSSVGAGIECGMVSSKVSSPSETVESSLTFEGIKVTVKVSEKVKKKKGRLSVDDGPQTTDKDIQTSFEPSEESPVNRNMTWNNQFSSTEATTSGSTSYMSPPSKLSPAHQSLLRSILSKIDAKNRNPRLHHYIKRVLEMSRKSIDELSVSSVSDFSVNSSICNRSMGKRPKSLGNSKISHKVGPSCRGNASWSDDSATKEQVLKFSEMAEGYAHRLQDLAGMMERMKILPDSRGGEVTEDSSTYLSPPAEVHQSVRLSHSVRAGVYPPRPTDDGAYQSKAHRASLCSDLPPSHIYPHPSDAVHFHPPPSLNTHSRKLAGTGLVDALAHELSTIQEGGESLRPMTPEAGGFDPDISSIRGSPQNQGGRDSTGSSLCLLDDRDISSWLGTSSDDYEEVFRSLGIAWALPTVRKTRQSQRRVSGSQSSSRSTGRGQYSHSTPLGQSPAKPPSSNAGCSGQQPPLSTDSDNLTPPSLSLNIPGSVWPKPRRSK